MVEVASFHSVSYMRTLFLHITNPLNSYAYFSSTSADPTSDSGVHAQSLQAESPVQAVAAPPSYSGRASSSSSADRVVESPAEQAEQAEQAAWVDSPAGQAAQRGALDQLCLFPPTHSGTPNRHGLSRAFPRSSSCHASAGSPLSSGKSLRR